MNSLKKILGIPRQSSKEQEDKEVIKTPEFDLTQFAKALVPLISVILGGVIAALHAIGVKEVSDPAVLVGALGVVAAAVLGMALIAATDVAARAFLSGEGSAAEKQDAGDKSGPEQNEVVAAPKGMQAWLEGSGPHPVLALRGGDEKIAYLLATGSEQDRTVGGTPLKAIDGTVKWCEGDEVKAIRAAGWT